MNAARTVPTGLRLDHGVSSYVEGILVGVCEGLTNSLYRLQLTRKVDLAERPELVR